MKQIELLYTKEMVAKLTGYSVHRVVLLTQEGILPAYSRKPLFFLVKEINAWLTPHNIKRYTEHRWGMFGNLDRVLRPGEKRW